MNTKELIKLGRLDEALASVQDAIRNNPADPGLRVFLFQLLCVLGDWDRALMQLQVLAELDAESMLLAQVYRGVIACELFRAEVFAGKRGPLVFGEPVHWIGQLVEANRLAGEGKFQAALGLRDRAFDSAPASTGVLDGQPFNWIADGDSRLGPLLEVVMDSRYYWVPFERIRRLGLKAPSDMRDLVWQPAQFTWANGGEGSGFIPTRYPGTERSADNLLRLARRTEWQERDGGYTLGLGQRVLMTDEGDRALLDCRKIEFAPSA